MSLERRWKRAQQRKCRRCKVIKSITEFIGRGQLCGHCRAEPSPSIAQRRLRACTRCHVVKDADEFDWGDGAKGRGTYSRRKGVCRRCLEHEAAEKRRAAEARQTTWKRNGVLVRRCSACGRVKPLKDGFYVTRPKSSGVGRWRYMCKQCDMARTAVYKKRTSKNPETRARYARWKREWAKRNPERYKAAQKRYAERVKADPKRYAVVLENNRIAYRLRQEARGRALGEIREQRAKVPMPVERLRRLSAAPLVAAIEAFARRVGIDELDACAQAGIDIRNLSGWRTGERQKVRSDVADRVLTNLDLCWWDVWPEDDPIAREVFEGAVAA